MDKKQAIMQAMADDFPELDEKQRLAKFQMLPVKKRTAILERAKQHENNNTNSTSGTDQAGN